MDDLLEIEPQTTLEAWGDYQVSSENLALLDSYYHDIAAAGKITRNQAKSLVEDLAVEFPSETSLESFTELPTRTNHAVALEAMGKGVVKTFVDLVKKAVAFLVKLVKWMAEQIQKLYHHFTGSQRYVKNLYVVRVANVKLRKAGLEAVSEMTRSDDMDNANTVRDEALARYKEHYTRLSTELLTNGKYYKAAKQAGLFLPHFVANVEKKLEYLYKGIRAKANGQSEETYIADVSMNFGLVKDDFRFDHAKNLYGHLELVNADGSHPTTSTDILKVLAATVRGLGDEKPAQLMPLDMAVDIIINPKSGFKEPVIDLPQTLIQRFNNVRKTLSSVSIQGADFLNYPKLQELYRQAINRLIEEIGTLQQVVSMATVLSNARDALIHDSLFYELKSLERYRTAAKDNGNPKVIEDVNRIQNEMRDDLDKK